MRVCIGGEEESFLEKLTRLNFVIIISDVVFLSNAGVRVEMLEFRCEKNRLNFSLSTSLALWFSRQHKVHKRIIDYQML
jgi:hypothetical protein